MLIYGDTRELTEEELARAVRTRPQPDRRPRARASKRSWQMLLRAQAQDPRDLRDRARSESEARGNFHDAGRADRSRRGKLRRALRQGRRARSNSATWNSSGISAGDDAASSPASCCSWSNALGEKYQVDELAAKYEFTGRTPMTVPEALEVKEELETIDKLLKQLEEATKTAQIGIIDMEELAEFAEPGDMEQLSALQQQIEDYMREHGRAAGARAGQAAASSSRRRRIGCSSRKLLDADLQPVAGVAHRPASGADRRRRRRRDAADQAVRVRRLGRAHGHPRRRWSTPCSAAGRGCRCG